MPVTSVNTPSRSVASMELADKALGKVTLGLRRSNQRKDDSYWFLSMHTQSGWKLFVATPSATSAVVVDELRTLFAQFGLRETIVADNGPCSVGTEFEGFLTRNGFKHLTSAPYHPASNDLKLAERAVQLVKKALKKTKSGNVKNRLARVLFSYRLTPQSTTGVSLSELLLGQRPRSRLNLLKPHTAEQVEKKQREQKKQHDARSRRRNLKVGTS